MKFYAEVDNKHIYKFYTMYCLLANNYTYGGSMNL
jgi:hypothetical protein